MVAALPAVAPDVPVAALMEEEDREDLPEMPLGPQSSSSERPNEAIAASSEDKPPQPSGQGAANETDGSVSQFESIEVPS